MKITRIFLVVAAILMTLGLASLALAQQAGSQIGQSGPQAGPQLGQTPPMVRLETSQGDITIALFPDKAPITVANFLAYVKSGFYDGLIFHRVIKDFMIQGGGFTPDMREKPTGKPIKNEANNGLKNDAYTVAMARLPEPDTASSQFFINTVNNAFLNFTAPTSQGYGYAVFGRVIAGREIVDKIKAAPTTAKGSMDDVPVTPVVIKKAYLVQQ